MRIDGGIVMKIESMFGWAAAGAAIMAPQAAIAADSVYMGDCNRARQVHQQSTIDTLLPHARYEGVQRFSVGDPASSACPRDYLITYSLTQKSRSTTKVDYDVREQYFLTGSNPTGCAAPARNGNPHFGTVSFTTKFEQKGELCEVYIWAYFSRYAADMKTLNVNFANRVLNLEGGSLILSQPAPVVGKYYTPIAFTGAK
jgi:hypothetical protein